MVQTDRQTPLSPLDYHYSVVEFYRTRRISGARINNSDAGIYHQKKPATAQSRPGRSPREKSSQPPAAIEFSMRNNSGGVPKLGACYRPHLYGTHA